MGSLIDFRSNGGTASGYLALPEGRRGPGVIVVQEWWGLDSGTKEMADRLAAAGFVALAPDLYHGELAGHTEMDKAAELMQAMPADRAARDMSGAVDYLADHDATSNDGIGVVGFCMGGMLTFLLAAHRPDRIVAAVPFYGFPQGDDQPNYRDIEASIQGHMAEHDDFFPPDAAKALEAELTAMGKDVKLTVHPGSGHAFMAPHNALGTQDQELYDQIWPQVVEFLHTHLDPELTVTAEASDDPIHDCIDRWHRHTRGELHGGLDALLHEGCVFLSPIVFTPQRGRDITKLYLRAAGSTLAGDDPDEGTAALTTGTSFRYTKEIRQGHHAMLEFETEVEGKYANGVDIITCDDHGRIVEFKVMMRPLQAINAVHAQMKAMLEQLAAG